MNQSFPKSFGFSRLFGFLDSLKPTDRWLFAAVLFVFFVSTIWSVYAFSQSKLINIPVKGGTLIEGAVGSPRFVNPVLAITRADNDLTTLTYSGLLRLAPNGELENDLAESVTVSDDGKVYNVILKSDRYFHDGTRINAEDVAFTIHLIQKPALKSPLYGNWNGVTVEVIDTYELNFVLEEPYAPFKENLTVGILPQHIWSTLSDEELPFSQHNIEPVGSGPYEVEEVKRNEAGLISEYKLRASENYESEAHINNIIFRFYQSEEAVFSALEKGEITSSAYISENLLSSVSQEQFNITSEPLPRVFSIFFNQNRNPALRDSAVREALEVLIQKDLLIEEAVNGYGEKTDSPIPPNWIDLPTENASLSREEQLAGARRILEEGNWQQNENGRWTKVIDEVDTPLIFTVRSANDALFERIASRLQQDWQDLGIEGTFEFYEQNDLVQTIIRPRDYQALLFGVDLGRSLDLYPFWHSASREDPGLNVSLYANIDVDNLVSDMRVATSTEVRDSLISEFVEEVEDEKPAIFLFSPLFKYVTNSRIETAPMTYIQKPNERFSNILNWNMNESGVWPFFTE